MNIHCNIHRGYYMVARRYEIYLRVFKSISHKWAHFSEDFRRFAKCCPKVMFPNIFRTFPKFPKLSEGVRRLPLEEDLKMFRLNIDSLWLIQHWNRANLLENVSKSISSHVKITCYFHMWRYDFFALRVHHESIFISSVLKVFLHHCSRLKHPNNSTVKLLYILFQANFRNHTQNRWLYWFFWTRLIEIIISFLHHK